MFSVCMRNFKTFFICGLAFLAFACMSATAQELSDSLSVFFRQGMATFDPDYKQNGDRCQAFVNRVQVMQQDNTKKIVSVRIYSSASPEGPESLNETLASNRAKNVLSYLRKSLSFEDSVVFVQPIVEDWEGLAAFVENDPAVPSKDEALAIIRADGDSQRKSRLQSLDGGKSWDYLYEKYFPQLRSFRAYVYVKPISCWLEIASCHDESFAEARLVPPTSSLAYVSPKKEAEPQWVRQVTLKTNAIGIGMGHVNVAAEVDLAPHWSVSVPFYYSGGFDYFKPTIKFRGIVLQPEARYYFKGNDGLYVGAHLGLGWYNYSVDGEFRIQDYKGRRPAWGGGLGAGYTLQFKKNPRWGMEFAVGAGVYDVKYDIFYNENNGPYAESGVHNTFFGVDNASVAFTYKFDLKRKEGRR